MRYSVRTLIVVGLLVTGLGIGAMILHREDQRLKDRIEKLELIKPSPAGSTHLRPTPAEQARAEAEFANLRPLLAAILKADKIILFEGLPHQAWEGDLLKQELQAKKTIRFHDYPFYLDPINLTKEDVERISTFFRDPNVFEVKLPGLLHLKGCGGFHPDYDLEFYVGVEIYHVLVCLGCGEVKFFGPTMNLYCYITIAAHPLFERTFKPYRQNRPISKN